MEIDAGDDATAFVIFPRDHRARNLWKPNLRYSDAFPETIILSIEAPRLGSSDKNWEIKYMSVSLRVLKQNFGMQIAT
ncbi:hypothetical protein E3N88_21133 [Mikania micrantha]|uniref:Uncharacterized protein n=1 Tax=Mikania micrantha TaxID=192012 RepID=A0A5N6NKL4_9ASTR|nr:hypothetical protein E3N88_21133 [Mikania micrantha]